MVTGEIKNKLDKLWDRMWSNQMTNPWIDIQQVTYLIFIKMLDDQQIKQEVKINDQIKHGIAAAAKQRENLGTTLTKILELTFHMRISVGRTSRNSLRKRCLIT